MGSVFLITSYFSSFYRIPDRKEESASVSAIPVGALELFPFDSVDDGSPVRLKKNFYLKDFIVKGSFRRVGIGSAMLEKANSVAIQNNYDSIYLNIHNEENEGSLSFYKKNGYHSIDYDDHLKALTEEHLPFPYCYYLMLQKKISGTR
jgi:ribosomal protein S18 acetylase RimI-like enzyme